MSAYEFATSAICERCYKSFNVNTTIYNSLNLDFTSSYANKLVNNSLNRVICSHCKTEFTYERPFVAYSFINKYAIMSDFSCNDKIIRHGRSYLFDLFKIANMKFRIVNYMCELSEKVRIFNSNLDDYKIEYVKYTHFGDEYFNDKQNRILLFKEIQNDNILFEFCDDIDNVLERHYIPYSEYEKFDLNTVETFRSDGLINWYKIDNIYIKELLNEH